MRSPTTGWYAGWLGGACAVLLASGCGALGSAEADGAAAAAQAFSRAVVGEPQAACSLLSDRTRLELEQEEDAPCAEALAAQDLPVGEAVRTSEVFGKDAIVHLDRDTIFLARFDAGWRVFAAGCRPDGERPYDCRVKAS